MSDTSKPNRKVYEGFIGEDDYGFLSIAEDRGRQGFSLVSEITDDWQTGQKVSVRYYISKNKTGENVGMWKLAKKLAGDLEAAYELDAYSEWSIMAWEEDLKVGGHDLIKELDSYQGKYLVLIIELAPTN